jgi:hypothetical protein
MTRTYKTPTHAARAYGRARNIRGNGGGWLYAAGRRFPLCQGWGQLARSLCAVGVIRVLDTRGTCELVPAGKDAQPK